VSPPAGQGRMDDREAGIGLDSVLMEHLLHRW
jgi:hypothetical protein